jgi:hypothetical protein
MQEEATPTPNQPPVRGTVEHQLWRFALIANKSSPHPNDWKRFYQFIVAAHGRRVKWTADEVKCKLRVFGFDERHAQDLASAYWHGRCALYMQRPSLITESHCGWMKKNGIPWN